MQGYRLDAELGYIPDIPLPYYCWQFWKWQKVQCVCGKTFISRDLGSTPREYEAHYALEHI